MHDVIYIPRGQAEVGSFTRPFLSFCVGGGEAAAPDQCIPGIHPCAVCSNYSMDNSRCVVI